MSQGMWVIFTCWKRQGNGSPVEPPERNADLQNHVLPSDTCVGLLTYRTIQ